MLRTAQNLRGVVTIFHSPRIAASQHLVQLANSKYADPTEHNFQLEVTEANPTADQFEELKKLSPKLSSIAQPQNLPRPTLVSWFAGKVAVEDEAKSLKILEEADKEAN